MLFLCVFVFIWGFGMTISYLQQRHRDMIMIKPDYKDFSPKKIESQRRQVMDDYKRQVSDQKAQQSALKTQQEAQKRLMEDQKRQLRDLQRMNKNN